MRRTYVCMYVCMYVRRTRPRAIPLAMTIKNYQHAFKYDYGAPLPRPTAAEEFRYKVQYSIGGVIFRGIYSLQQEKVRCFCSEHSCGNVADANTNFRFLDFEDFLVLKVYLS